MNPALLKKEDKDERNSWVNPAFFKGWVFNIERRAG